MASTPAAQTSITIVPGHSLGAICLGSSVHEVLTHLREQKDLYSSIDLHFSQSQPLLTPIVISLPGNGLRLHFDGADQRLRLIEVLDFRKVKLVYKGSEISKPQDELVVTSGPAFKRVYQIFGASYPGEYIASKDRNSPGTYVLSWPGVAFNFPLQSSAWSANKDHVSLLSSSAAGPASHMAVFEGNSWPEARDDLFTRAPDGPRSSALALRPKDSLPCELEAAEISLDGRIEFTRREAAPFVITIGETELQDLITELGPPDATHRREERLDTTEMNNGTAFAKAGHGSRPYGGSQPSSYSSTGTDTFDSDFDAGDLEDDALEIAARQKFWCYFQHGMDILVGPCSNPDDRNPSGKKSVKMSTQVVVQRVIIHGNVPGSYAFNRHRRLRWAIDLAIKDIKSTSSTGKGLTSEDNFETALKPTLLRHFAKTWPESEMMRGKVVNRTWGASPSDSNFFLPDAGEDLIEGTGSEQWLGNTKLYSFPGFVFEVTDNGCVSALTVHQA